MYCDFLTKYTLMSKQSMVIGASEVTLKHIDHMNPLG